MYGAVLGCNDYVHTEGSPREGRGRPVRAPTMLILGLNGSETVWSL